MPESRRSLELHQANLDAGMRRHDETSLRLKATDFNHPRGRHQTEINLDTGEFILSRSNARHDKPFLKMKDPARIHTGQAPAIDNQKSRFS
jgi:hypothetical protein